MGLLLGLVIIGAHRRIGWQKLAVSAGVVALLAAIPLAVSGEVRTEVTRRAAGVATALGMPPPQQAPQNPDLPVCGRGAATPA